MIVFVTGFAWHTLVGAWEVVVLECEGGRQYCVIPVDVTVLGGS